MTKTRFMYVLLIASLFAYVLASLHGSWWGGMSDGGGLHFR